MQFVATQAGRRAAASFNRNRSATLSVGSHLTSSARAVASALSRRLPFGQRFLSPSFSPLICDTKNATTMAPAASSVSAPVVEKAETAPKPIFRKDYTPTPYLVDKIYLKFNLNEDVCTVESSLDMKPNYSNDVAPPLFLNGRKDITLVSVAVNGTQLKSNEYDLQPESLTILSPPSGEYKLEVVVNIKPQENTLLEGLYKSSGFYCTQCEAEGFRGITYFYDRPDVMSKYTTRIEADKKLYPVLLGNGNLVESGDLADNRHFAVWEDPFPKPCYLFALVAGDLAVREDKFTTMSNRPVTLRIFAVEKNIHKVDFAMEALKKSMKWDEEKFSLEYDLDLFNIVVVDDFNMGAMENKSLNLFNSTLVLADAETATDGDFERIEGVVGHEYFHNWTGNRVTCRDWFQLTLKEGLTVFRDQEFSADMNSRPVKRIDDVAMLRTAQFTEDAGPQAHPIRPESYIKMDNFYTLTVYEKGAAIVRLYDTLLGKEGFRKGMDLYFKRHDGQAVTCDDFLAAMADANEQDLSGLKTWYSQAGTPVLTISTSYNASQQTYTITAKQSIKPTPGQPEKQPVLIPIDVALFSQDGQPLPLKLQGSSTELGTSTILRLTTAEASFTFTDVPSAPIPSLLRGFSAPVKLVVEGQTEEDLVFLMAHDTDPFNRWDAGQRLAKKILLELYEAAVDEGKGSTVEDRCAAAAAVPPAFIDAVRAIITDDEVDGSFKAMAIGIPSMSELLDVINEADPTVLHDVRMYLIKQIAQQLRPELEAVMKKNDVPPGEPYNFNAAACARRAICNKALSYLSMLKDNKITAECMRRFQEATNMTDRLAALACLNDIPGDERETALAQFYDKYKDDDLVVLKWLRLVAGSTLEGTLKKVETMLSHPAFKISNPNCCYALFLVFARNYKHFHAVDGSGYAFLGDAVLTVDKLNRQVAARMVRSFDTWKQFDKQRQGLMKQQLQRIVDTKGLSENTYEIASKSLSFE